MGILSWIVFGLIAGIIAKLLMPGRDPGGCIITMLLGVAGAFVGGFLYRLVTGTEVLYFGFDFRSFAIAVLGAGVILWPSTGSSSGVEPRGRAANELWRGLVPGGQS
jgi:uncharacterized membrane protein YeaQ/YmgE (transglycosylase-associated protein family)